MDLTFSELPNFNVDLQQIIHGKGLMQLTTCDPVNRSDINLLLYIRNRDEPTELDSVTVTTMSPNKKLIIIIHGWLSHSTSYGVQPLKDAYLQRYDCNVVIVNWDKLSHQLYSTAVCQLPKIGDHVVDLLVLLRKEKIILSSDVHIVGHSLGGQMSGLIGDTYFKKTGEKLDRLTGLDPAGPLFVDEPREKRIDSTDAVFVDVIHTNGGMFGYYGNCGTVDFYINCGSVQPNCYAPSVQTFTTHNVEDLGALAVACSHMRSFDYMIEAVNTKFEATPCTMCPLGCPPILSFFKSKTVMGEDCDRTAKGGYYLSKIFG
ncbi:hypothetical protein FQR65_LT01666 [Abscondita terminalis]|nr:hypothetical protein FQR65_LT01666 [Abscondita terminalis]